MKKLLPFLLLTCLFAFVSCDKDDDGDTAQLLRYDGGNDNAPALPGGNYVMGVRFPGNETEVFQGEQLTEIRFYVQNPPKNLSVRVYGAGANQAPGTLLYESPALTALVESDSWYTHVLTDPIDITGDEIWLGVAFSHDDLQRSIGCDAGPREGNGDFLFDESANEWSTFFAGTGESVNWNIRGKIGE